MDDEELTEKLEEYGCTIKGSWHRKTYPEYPNIENGIRYVRLELPSSVQSLPYAIVINKVHMRLKHNGQSKVCNLCLGNDHIMRNCPKYLCKICNRQGHTESHCPNVECFNCHEMGHKSYNCPQNNENAQDENNDMNPSNTKDEEETRPSESPDTIEEPMDSVKEPAPEKEYTGTALSKATELGQNAPTVSMVTRSSTTQSPNPKPLKRQVSIVKSFKPYDTRKGRTYRIKVNLQGTLIN
ncbi:putative zinc finger CCHC domain-containing protein 10-like [Apostichopus japonicus]|uniref:Putative zinc finger CCHC domain-containing protein 10-like n=1 Tax=Stichopus japonicus TaxID=307972 RepID=A0A2G8JV70_STIJA|nr:putative zinc finger CCHC domain-containing protein 10-like [Apostichopus japonicus]